MCGPHVWFLTQKIFFFNVLKWAEWRFCALGNIDDDQEE